MENKIEKIINNKKLIVKESSYEKATLLKNEIFKVVKRENLDMGLLVVGGSLEEWAVFITQIDIDKECHKLLMDCLEDCSYDGKPLSQELFLIEGDLKTIYYDILYSVFEVNIRPFLVSLTSLLSVKLQEKEALVKNLINQE